MNETTLLLSIVGTGIGVTAVVVSVIAVVASGINSRLNAVGSQLNTMDGRLNTMDDRIDALRSDMREDHQRLDARLRHVEIEFGKVGQRLETLERAVIPQAPPAA